MNNYANVKFGNECRSKLIEGVNLAANAVEVTYGPSGKNSIVSIGGQIKITKDGDNTVMMVNDPDPYIGMGIKLIQETCQKTAKDVGDGSSSSAIMVRELVNSFKDFPNSIQVSRELQNLSQKMIFLLQGNARPIANKEDLIKVASISANNDPIIGNVVAEAFNQVGKDGIVTIEESDGVKDKVEYSEGFRIDSGYYSPYFINTSKNTCELENVRVYISDIKMEELKEVVRIADQAVKDKKSLLLIAPEFDSEILVFLSSNLNLLKSCVVLSPNHGNFRNIMLQDMRLLLGDAMECRKVVITKDTTTFVGLSNIDSEERVQEIRSLIEEGDLPEMELNFHRKRLANFTSGIATIYVGGYSKVEMQERYDRFEDSVCATQASLKEGVLAGGGISLMEITKTIVPITEVEKRFVECLKVPATILGTLSKTTEDMIRNGVIEPFLVTKTVLEHAISTASMILTADVAILNNPYMN